MAPTDEQRDQAWQVRYALALPQTAWQDRYTRLAIEADGRWSNEHFAALAVLGAERDEERRKRSVAAAFRRIITKDEEA